MLRLGLEGVWGWVVSEARRADVKFFRGGTQRANRTAVLAATLSRSAGVPSRHFYGTSTLHNAPVRLATPWSPRQAARTRRRSQRRPCFPAGAAPAS